MKPTAIHQFHSGSAYGDAVTNSMFYIQKMLSDLGFESNIYVEHVAEELKNRVLHYKKFKPNENQALLIHHSIGHDLDDWLRSLKVFSVLVYHNITPAHFFPKDSPLHHYSEKGRKQLDMLRAIVKGGIGDSKLNTDELIQAGYAKTETIPMLIDVESVLRSKADASIIETYRDSFNVLFVGRVVENKCQHDLIEIFRIFCGMTGMDSRLILVGDTACSAPYFKRLTDLVDSYGLSDIVHFAGKVSSEELYSYYRIADVFLCMSEHEGFGVPLVEAMLFDVPVIAYNSPDSSVKDTMNRAGFVFDEKNHEYAAGLVSLLSRNRGLRRKFIESQRENLEAYHPATIKSKLVHFLSSLGLEIDGNPSYSPVSSRMQYRFEGPFDSSYSLALVNREMATALNSLHPGQVSLYSTDGPGDFEPHKEFLSKNPKMEELWLKSQQFLQADIVCRNLYPPRVYDMQGRINMLNSYGWEESSFPQHYVNDFNFYLDGLTVMSQYVRKTMIDNGVHVPTAVVGVGVDHILRVAPLEYKGCLGKKFKFLHISSCFPRKGVDLLLTAFVNTFSSRDDVSLVIKTFPNVHNTIESQIGEIRRNSPDCPDIVLINEDMADGYLVDLYKKCDALVAPSRGEGFGLPMAEAMVFGLPVITTGYGGQSDFCTAETSWLIDYEFSGAKTHLGLFNSAWVEPDTESLGGTMRLITELPEAEKKKKTDKAKSYVLSNFAWQHCAQRLDSAVQGIENQPVFRERIRLGWVSSWNSKCGIATYSKYLVDNLPLDDFDLKMFASNEKDRVQEDQDFVFRCWENYNNEKLRSLADMLIHEQIDAVVIQFNFSFFEIHALGELIDKLNRNGIRIFITLHSAIDVDKPDFKASLSWISHNLKRADRILVHNIADMNRLKKLGLIDNVTLFPHGVMNRTSSDVSAAKRKHGFSDTVVISSYGFLLPHKGIRELIEAFSLLHKRMPNTRLLLLNALYPVPQSAELKKTCAELINQYNLNGTVTMVNDFLSDEESLDLLQCSDLIVFPYQHTQESASGAIRFGLASKRPVACTPLEIFNDVKDLLHVLPGTTPEEIAEGIGQLLGTPAALTEKISAQEKWLEEHSWEVLGERLGSIIKSLT